LADPATPLATNDGPEPVRTAAPLSIKILTALAILGALYIGQNLMVPVLIGIFSSYALNPLVDGLTRWRVPRALASMLVVLSLAGSLGWLAYQLSDEAAAAVRNVPEATRKLRSVVLKATGGGPSVVQELQQAADAVAKLNPKPGRMYSEGGDNYVVPDLIVEKVEGEYLVFINDANLPRLKLSRAYQEIARDKKKFDGENKEFISNKLNSANWMIQAIEQRRQTMLKVMNFIVDRQREFFEKGIEYLKPLTLREVAEVISMHESTVSRVTNEKYVQTPRGVLPLKFFFSSALSTATGEDASARSIRAKLEKMVGEENPAKPLTDQQIVHLFEEQGIQIARRTVAKYRDQLGILPARMRKRV